jgi:hypothetical protein
MTTLNILIYIYVVSARITLVAKAAYSSGLGRHFFKGHTLNTFDIDIYTSQQKNQYKDFFLIYFYVKPKTIVYYHLRQCLRETRLSSYDKQ